ncbi:MAG: hypothetical protein RL685_823, partial [Pseudomonadota bacterium]
FCPNCGTKNDDTATPCKKCGFKLSGASAPKFRGTMMLNSDQSVQDLVEEHRKKLTEAGLPQDPPEAGGPTPPLPSVGSTPPKAVFQPPRAASPKRRMGTMLGVAPQVGGVRPAGVPVPSPTPAPVDAPTEAVAVSTPDPFAGTVAFGAVSPVSAPALAPPAPGVLTAGRTEAFAAVSAASAPTPSPAFTAGRTEAFAAPPASEPLAPAAPVPLTIPTPEPAATPPATAPIARGRTEAFDAAPTADPSAAALQGDLAGNSPSLPPVPQRHQVRPLDIFLIIITCGLYGLVLWARQRKPV